MKLKLKLEYSKKKVKNPFGDKRRKLPAWANIWFPILKHKHPISFQGADDGIIDAIYLEQVIVLEKCFQLQEPNTSPGYLFCVSEWDAHEDEILSLFDPEAPQIAAWLHPVGHVLEPMLGWSDQEVLDDTRVTIQEELLTYFHQHFV